MEIIVDLLGYLFVEIVLGYILLYPGALIIWGFTLGKKSYKDIIKNEKVKSILIGLFFLIIILIICW
tara:strand:- start:142 stop:342 length:201 start_codon:yes stop_codon:yes gene_type:complete